MSTTEILHPKKVFFKSLTFSLSQNWLGDYFYKTTLWCPWWWCRWRGRGWGGWDSKRCTRWADRSPSGRPVGLKISNLNLAICIFITSCSCLCICICITGIIVWLLACWLFSTPQSPWPPPSLVIQQIPTMRTSIRSYLIKYSKLKHPTFYHWSFNRSF